MQVKMEAVEILQQNDTEEVVAEVKVTVSEIPRQNRMKGLSVLLQHCLDTSSRNSEDIPNE